MPHLVNTHEFSTIDKSIRIEATGDPESGGDYPLYTIYYKTNNQWQEMVKLRFQKGPLGELGPNGMTNEVLLSVVIDRLKTFQKGPYPCLENEAALRHAQESLLWLHERTRDRLLRNVDGRMSL